MEGFLGPDSGRQSRLRYIRVVCAAKLHFRAIVPSPLTLNSLLTGESIAGAISNDIFIALCIICLLLHALARNHDLYGNTNLNNAIHQS